MRDGIVEIALYNFLRIRYNHNYAFHLRELCDRIDGTITVIVRRSLCAQIKEYRDTCWRLSVY